MTSFTSPTGVKFDIVSGEGGTPELHASKSEPSSEPNPVVVEGAFALLRTSLTSMLWFWPLRQYSQSVSAEPPTAKKHRRRSR
jgi:hypothetical protein